ncbi:MAG TPA: LPS export ABC transporter permease LptF [Vicinamibacterales bacterium]|nr:LPS export ABC transporter permease LptF [Vicinamibacterales bacterium]
MRILDRYIIREILLPFAIALVVLSFVLIIPFIIELAEQLIQKGVSWPTILQLTVTLLPAQLGLTIPMALLIAVLIAFGRLSGDREIVVLMACGVSPYRLLRPVFGLGLVAAAATLWVMIEAIPDANQTYREITTRIVADRAEGQVRPRVFFEDFPNTVLYVREVPQGGGWRDVIAVDTRDAAQPILYVARSGRMVVDREARTIQMVLEDGAQHRTQSADPAGYEIARFQEFVLALDPESVFPRVGPARGERELRIPELQELRATLEARNLPFHRPVIEIHKKFSIPAACLVFALLAVGLGVTNRKDGKLASFVLGLAVIFAYYVIMFGAEAMAKGALIPAWSAMWIPNVVLGGLGLAVLMARTRGVGYTMRFKLPAVRWPVRRAREAGPPGDSMQLEVASPHRAERGTVVVIRIPQFEVPRPQLLDLYVARTYGRMLLICIVGIMGLFYISTFLDKSDKLFKGEVTLATLFEYLWWETPQFLYYIIAIAVLLSAIITVGLLTKNSELIVMRACGISLYRTALPLIVFAAIASGVLFAFEERVLAFSNRRADYLNHIIRGGDSQTFDVVNRKWLVGAEGEIYHYQYFDPRRRALNMLSVFRFNPETLELDERVYATQAVYAPRTAGDPEPWAATGGWARTLAGAAVTRYAPFAATRLSLEPPNYFETEAPEPDRMNFVQLGRYIEELQTSGYNVTEYEVALQRKFAFPLVTLVMTLIAVPFAVTTGKRGAMYGIGVGIVLALVYWTAISVFAAFGASGLMSPALAAWAPNLLFGATAAYLLLTVRT